MRVARASLIALTCCLALAIPGWAVDSETLKGNVTKDDAPNRVARPKTDVLKGSADATTATPNTKVHAAIQSGSFDLDAQRGRLPAGITEGMLQGWIQSPLSREEDPRAGQADMDRFFAFGHVSRPAQLAAGVGAGPQGPPGLHVFVRMGLCGSWDAGGDGMRRWANLVRELHSPQLGPAWSQWQREVSDIVQSQLADVPATGAAGLHVAVTTTGGMESITDYNDNERPMQYLGASRDVSEQAQAALRNLIYLPRFPSGSQCPEAHILIFVTHY